MYRLTKYFFRNITETLNEHFYKMGVLLSRVVDYWLYNVSLHVLQQKYCWDACKLLWPKFEPCISWCPHHQRPYVCRMLLSYCANQIFWLRRRVWCVDFDFQMIMIHALSRWWHFTHFSQSIPFLFCHMSLTLTSIYGSTAAEAGCRFSWCPWFSNLDCLA